MTLRDLGGARSPSWLLPSSRHRSRVAWITERNRIGNNPRVAVYRLKARRRLGAGDARPNGVFSVGISTAGRNSRRSPASSTASVGRGRQVKHVRREAAMT